MVKCGFEICKYNPCLFHHSGRKMLYPVHGDNFVCVADADDLKWLKEQLRQRFEIKTKTMVLKEGESKEERILNRVIRVNGEGWEYEADQGHADLIIQEAGRIKNEYPITNWRG